MASRICVTSLIACRNWRQHRASCTFRTQSRAHPRPWAKRSAESCFGIVKDFEVIFARISHWVNEGAFPLRHGSHVGLGMAGVSGKRNQTTKTYYEEDLLTLPFETSGFSTITAANGDQISTDIVGRGTPTEDANILSVREEHVITGGTGRFEGVSGGFVRTYFLNRLTGDTSGVFEGTIVLQHGNRQAR